MPIVLFDHRLPGLEADYVGTDNQLAAAMLTEHLIRLGHRRIAWVGGMNGVYTAERCREGYEATLRAHGLPVDPDLQIDGGYSGEGGYAAALHLLTRPGNRPTAILVASNLMAIGALQACNEPGIACPAQVSLAGTDDVPWSDVIRPRITCAIQQVDEMARVACRMLMERIDDPDAKGISARDIVHPPQFRIRDSTAPPCWLAGEQAWMGYPPKTGQ